MNYKRRVEKAIAFKVPQRVEFADSQIALEGDWLVFQDGHMDIFTDEDFNSLFEPDIPSVVIKDKPIGGRGIQLGDLGKLIDPYRQYYQPMISYSSIEDPSKGSLFDQRG